eukprot:TRINITY_DN22491_c0_g1_i3.p1 TRINITY_DN22491_c0_g1~~TRINITY_DN22491_c0_g1_i3.p1  ORF type:complete len:902 (-),score=136.57 TRINITY_DN22491_c0_g1_i3:69-2600(-)
MTALHTFYQYPVVCRYPRSLVRMLLDARALSNEVDSEGRAPLHIAAACGTVKQLLFKELLWHGEADVNQGNADGDTPLHLVLQSVRDAAKKLSCVKRLLQVKALPLNENCSGQSALDLAHQQSTQAGGRQLQALLQRVAHGNAAVLSSSTDSVSEEELEDDDDQAREEAFTSETVLLQQEAAAMPARRFEKKLAILVSNANFIRYARFDGDEATALEAALQKIGFEVTMHEDLDRATMSDVFSLRYLDTYVSTLLFIAVLSHGIEDEDGDLLLAAKDSDPEIRSSHVRLTSLFEHLDANASDKLDSVVLLDCCRESRLHTTFQSQSKFAKQLREKKQPAASSGSPWSFSKPSSASCFIVYACDPGTLAAASNTQHKDKRLDNFMEAVIHHIGTPGKAVREVFESIVKHTMESTKEKQRPWVSDCLRHPLMLVDFHGAGAACAACGKAATKSKETSGWNGRLRYALSRRHWKCAAAFLADDMQLLEQRDGRGQTPLQSLAYEAQLQPLQYLLKAGANVNARTRNGFTALHQAVWSGTKGIQQDGHACVCLLLEAHASINAQSDRGTTPLHNAVGVVCGAPAWFSGNVFEQRRRNKIRGRFPMRAKREDEFASAGKDIVILLLAAGASVNVMERKDGCVDPQDSIRRSFGYTPLCFAVKYGNTWATRLLLERAADANVVADCYGNTPLLLALSSGAARVDMEIIRMLLSGRADVEHSEHTGTCPIHQAAGKGVHFIEALIDAQANPHVLNEHGESCLHTAARLAPKDQVLPIMRFLLLLGLDPAAKKVSGTTAADMCRSSGKLEAACMLDAAAAGTCAAASKASCAASDELSEAFRRYFSRCVGR